MKTALPLLTTLLFIGQYVAAEIEPSELAKGGRYLFNGVAACEVIGVGSAGVRIKFLSGGTGELSTAQALQKLSIPKGGCRASLTDTRKQLAMIDEENESYSAGGNPTQNSAPSKSGDTGSTVTM